jgi:hypothetical protein
MNRTLISLGCSLLLLVSSYPAQAQIYKHTDANGRVTYSNMPTKGAVKLDIEPPASNGNAAPPESRPQRAKTPANFPRVDRKTQEQRDDKRKQILQSELEIEKQALEEAQKAYEEGKAKPEVYRTANGRTFRNVAKYEEKIQRLQADVDLHKGNIELLQKELATLN